MDAVDIHTVPVYPYRGWYVPMPCRGYPCSGWQRRVRFFRKFRTTSPVIVKVHINFQSLEPPRRFQWFTLAQTEKECMKGPEEDISMT